jgi:hypothetical protein
MTSIPQRLREIAERIDEADAERASALAELAALVEEHRAAGASVLVADEEHQPAAEPATATAAAAPTESGQRAGAGARTAVGAPAVPSLPCPDCDRSFATASALGVHRRHRHGYRAELGARWTCPVCQADIKAVSRTRHEREAHPTAEPAPPTPILHKGLEWFICDRCPERFRSRDEMVIHRGGHPAPTRGNPVGRPGIHASAIGGTLVGS